MTSRRAEAVAQIAAGRLLRMSPGVLPNDLLDEIDGRADSPERDRDVRRVIRALARLGASLEARGRARLHRLEQPVGRTRAELDRRRSGLGSALVGLAVRLSTQDPPGLDDLREGGRVRVSGLEGVPDGTEFVVVRRRVQGTGVEFALSPDGGPR